MDKIKIIATNDGSFSLYNEELEETYHSRHGALQESVYVFIEQGLKFLLSQRNLSELNILEVGFGTGLNALLTLNEIHNSSVSVNYSSLETFPLSRDVWSELNYPDPNHVFSQLHESPWQISNAITSNFSLRKIQSSLLEVVLEQSHYDLIYFDAFAPNKQPEMWEPVVLEKVALSMKSGAAFVTYCAKGQLKRDLKSLGLVVESLPGPPGKREMVRAIKP